MQTVTFVAAAYDASAASLSQFLRAAYRRDLAGLEEGDIFKALADGYLGHQGLLTYNHTETADQQVAEVGDVEFGGVLFYTTYIAWKSARYVYAIEIHLVLEDTSAAKPTDADYADLYKQLVSQLVLTD